MANQLLKPELKCRMCLYRLFSGSGRDSEWQYIFCWSSQVQPHWDGPGLPEGSSPTGVDCHPQDTWVAGEQETREAPYALLTRAYGEISRH